MDQSTPDKSIHTIDYDLHIHSTISDGTLTPYEIIDLAVKKNLKGICITDHDDICHDHIKEYAEKKGIKYIYGMEFSTDISNLHIIGYNLDINNPSLKKYINFQKAERENAIRAMCKKSVKYNVPIHFGELKKFNTRSLGRPHLAELMIEKGYVNNFYEAFQKYLKTDKPVFVDYKKYPFIDILKIIYESNGIAVWAHPGMIKHNIFQSNLNSMIKNGLNGLEIYYPRHSKKQVEYFKDIAKANNLLITGGSDFHGSTKPDIKLGCTGVSEEEYEDLIKNF